MEQIQPRQPMRNRLAHRLTIAILMLCNGFLLLYAILLVVDNNFDFENKTWGTLIFGGTAIVGTLLLLDPVRVVVGHIFPKRKHVVAVANAMMSPFERMFGFATPILRDGEMIVDRQVLRPDAPRPVTPTTPYPDKPEILGFDPHSTIHMLALVLAVFGLGLTFAEFVLSGGLSGQSASFEQSGLELAISAIIQFAIFVGGAVFGVGLFFRRDWSGTMRRLGFYNFSWTSVGVGFLAAIGCLGVIFMMLAVWVSIVGIDKVQEQSEQADALVESINTIWLVLLIAVTSSVGEEIAFRGALQPVFGLWPTAVFFALIHSQYLFTPATLIIFVPAIVFGYLRRRYNLYATITAHFAYNFIQLLNALLVSSS